MELPHDSPLDPVRFVHDRATQFPEMLALAGAAELAALEPTDGPADERLLGQRLFPDVSDGALWQFNRTATGLLALEWTLRDEYEPFTACQAEEPDRLTPEGFGALKTYTADILTDDNTKQALQLTLVINGLLKTDPGLLERLTADPGTSPSFAGLPERQRTMLLETLRTPFKLGQFMLGENVPASLAELHGLSQETLDFYKLFSLYNVAGAGGHVRQDGSAVITEPTWQNFAMASTALDRLDSASLPDTYDTYLYYKARQLGIPVTGPVPRVLPRLACMLKYSTPAQGNRLAAAFRQLPASVAGTLQNELSRTGVDDAPAILPFLAPGVFDALRQGYREHDSGGRTEHETIFMGCVTLARAFRQARDHLGDESDPGVFTLRLDQLAASAANPARLHQGLLIVERTSDTEGAASIQPHAGQDRQA